MNGASMVVAYMQGSLGLCSAAIGYVNGLLNVTLYVAETLLLRPALQMTGDIKVSGVG